MKTLSSVEDIDPHGERVVIREDPAPERTPSGQLFYPDPEKEKPTRGTVLAVGPGKKRDDGSREPMPVEVGDKVLYGPWTGVGVETRDEGEVLLVPASQLFCIMYEDGDQGAEPVPV